MSLLVNKIVVKTLVERSCYKNGIILIQMYNTVNLFKPKVHLQ